MSKNKKIIILSILLLIIFSSNTVMALEVPLPGLGSDPSIGDYIVYIFKILIGLAGTIAAISFVWGAIGLINPNIEAHNNAKDRMKGAILGLVLTLSSVVIITTINPQLKTINITPLTGVTGVFYVKGDENLACPIANADNSTRPEGFDTIKYECPNNEGPKLLIWMYNKKNFDYSSGLTLSEVDCGGTVSVNEGSFQMAYQTNGVYLFLGSGCSKSEYSSITPYTSSVDGLPAPFAGNVRSIKIVNDSNKDLYYGAIFHTVPDLKKGGICTAPEVNTDNGEKCFDIPTPSATLGMDIMKLQKDIMKSGTGITFYSEPFGWNKGSQAGFFEVLPQTIKFKGISPDPSLLEYKWTNIKQPEAYTTTYKNFKIRPGSIGIGGSYLVGLYSGNSGAYCQTFTENVSNLEAQPFVASGQSLYKVWMFR